jgi:hypothetical protein
MSAKPSPQRTRGEKEAAAEPHSGWHGHASRAEPLAYWSPWWTFAVWTRQQAALLLVVLYAALMIVNPVLHDDLACHLNSPTQCNACMASPSASRVEGMAPILPVLADAGLVEPCTRTVVLAAPAPALPGRSPPA